MDRIQHLENWIQQQFPGMSLTLHPASVDASFRRYFRVQIESKSYIAMDAPPDRESCTPFVNVAELLVDVVHVPEIHAQNAAQGFLLLSDLGDLTYLQALTDRPEAAPQLYSDAADALIKMQQLQLSNDFPIYDEALLRYELNLFPEWYIAKHIGIDLNPLQKAVLDKVFALILQNNLSQPRVFVHRDYHSRNLMVATPNPGILDFQDAVLGPVTYDLVSLFKDAYIQWDEEQILDWIIRYWEKARRASLPVQDDFGDFYRDFEWMGVQRHIKVLGIFARLAYRDGKYSYLDDIPVVMRYLRKACERYHALKPLLNLLDEIDNNTPEREVGYTF